MLTSLGDGHDNADTIGEPVVDQSIELDAVYNSAPIGLALIGRDLRYRRVNRLLAELNGRPVEAHPGRTVREVMPALAETIEPLLRRVLDTGDAITGIEIRGLPRQTPGHGRIWLADFHPIRDRHGTLVGIGTTVREITQRKRLEQQLRRSETRFRMALRDSQAHVCEIDRDLRLTWMYNSVTGLPAEMIIGRRADELLPPQDAADLIAFKRTIIDSGERQHREVTLRLPDGVHVYDVKGDPLFDDARTVTGAVIVATDITYLKDIESSLAEALAQKETLIKEINHRIKNSLQLVGSLLLLQAALEKEGTVKDHLSSAAARITTVAQLHRSLYSGGDVKAVDLEQYLQDVVTAVGRLDGGSHPVTLHMDTVTVPADQAIAIGILVNELLTNAIKHAYPAGTGGVAVEVARCAGGLRLSVCDHGVGLPEHYRGAGTLGIQIVDAMARQLRGALSVETGATGTSFTVLVPLGMAG